MSAEQDAIEAAIRLLAAGDTDRARAVLEAAQPAMPGTAQAECRKPVDHSRPPSDFGIGRGPGRDFLARVAYALLCAEMSHSNERARAVQWIDRHPRLWAALSENESLTLDEIGWSSRCAEDAAELEQALSGEPHPLIAELQQRAEKHGLKIAILPVP